MGHSGKKRILIVGTMQLPHRILFDKCRYLWHTYDITIISPDTGKEKLIDIHIKAIFLNKAKESTRIYHIIHYKKFKNFLRFLELIKFTRDHLQNNPYDLVLIWSHSKAFMFKLFCKNHGKYAMMIFTQGVSDNYLKNLYHDYWVRFNALFFDTILLYTERDREYFKIPKQKAHIMGLGINAIAYRERSFDSMNLIYLGTLSNRYVHDTVKGFAEFYSEYGDSISVNYLIIGTGNPQDTEQLINSIENAGKNVPVRYLGGLDDNELVDVFNKSNIGVNYLKVTSYFTHNISTKTYEYLLSGMPVISVKLNSLIGVIDDSNGCFIEDTSKGFKDGLIRMTNNMKRFQSSVVAKSGEHGSAKSIVEKNWIPALESILDK